MQERLTPVPQQWSCVFLALTHRCVVEYRSDFKTHIKAPLILVYVWVMVRLMWALLGKKNPMKFWWVHCIWSAIMIIIPITADTGSVVLCLNKSLADKYICWGHICIIQGSVRAYVYQPGIHSKQCTSELLTLTLSYIWDSLNSRTKLRGFTNTFAFVAALTFRCQWVYVY